ncbi:MAG: nucleotide exchange factor GrpE [Clostridiales Family XIII bacterium]|jgi:molecular chaperone GrpE|nr:nucleotide exchange factor GrpE [Clostridiales Family XIII bacterium]
MNEKKQKKEPKGQERARKAAASEEIPFSGDAETAAADAASAAGATGAAGAVGSDNTAGAASATDAMDAAGAEYTAAGAEEPQEDADTRYIRLVADFQNFKRRTEKEKSDIYAYANEKFAADLLEVIDNFERAIAQDAGSGADEKFIEGMRMIMEQFVNVLERNDIEEIPATGADFDPNVHNAVQMMASKDYASGKVMEVIQKGYKIKEKVLRPATVVVAQ